MPSQRAGPELASGVSGRDQSAGEELLDNPMLNSLLTDHGSFALAEGAARRYLPWIGPLSGAPDQSRASYDALATLAGPSGVLAMFLADPPRLPADWSLSRGGSIVQMICRAPRLLSAGKLAAGVSLRKLGAPDVSAMLELAKLTEPGPFRERTIELGNFYGIFEGNRLLAMAGQRMRVPGFVEVSAVCTHPDARGRGHAGIAMSEVMRDIVAENRTPFLHAFTDNPAVSLYQRLGFKVRRTFHLAVIKNEA